MVPFINVKFIILIFFSGQEELNPLLKWWERDLLMFGYFIWE